MRHTYETVDAHTTKTDRKPRAKPRERGAGAADVRSELCERPIQRNSSFELLNQPAQTYFSSRREPKMTVTAATRTNAKNAEG